MSWVKHKKRKKVQKVVRRGFRFIFNNLVKAYEVYRFATDAPGAILDRVQDEYGRAVEQTDEVKQKLSRDYEDAERYVREGVSEARDVVEDFKGVFSRGE